MSDDHRYKTFEIELQLRDGADVSAMDIKRILARQSLDYQVRRVESGDALEGDEYDIAWGDN